MPEGFAQKAVFRSSHRYASSLVDDKCGTVSGSDRMLHPALPDYLEATHNI